MPPSLRLDVRIAGRFFEQVRAAFGGAIACEPRHASWSAARDVMTYHLQPLSRAASAASGMTASRPMPS
jgi:hypothetical protein